MLRADLDSPRTAPTLPTWNPLGHLAGFRRDPIGLFLRAREECGDIVRIRTGPKHIHALFHPDHVERVLVKEAAKYGKHTRGYEKLRLLLGDGLLTSEGDHWRRQRRLANPAFHRDCLAGFAAIMGRAVSEHALDWARRTEPFDLSRDMAALTLRIAGETMFGARFEEEIAVVGDALEAVLPQFTKWTSAPYPFPERLPTAGNRGFQEAVRALDAVVGRIVEARRRDDGEHRDLLGLMMAGDENGDAMTDRQLRDEVVTMLLAGHETTANALVWTFEVLDRHPDVVARAREELAPLGGRAPGFADLGRLPFLRQVLDESMRLRPPVWILGRSATEEDAIAGFRIPKGSYVYVPTYVVHRHPDFWPDPERFDPDRFSPEASAGRPKGAYLPFSLGQRKCIGDRFALVEAQIVLGALLPRFDVAIDRSRPIASQATLVLKPSGGLPARVRAIA